MRRALRLAVRSMGRTWPNPGVGCVIARDGELLGQGRHQRCGEAHAEIRALEDCVRRGTDPRGATAYVTLAPCTRHGRTPPCCDALVRAGLARVVAAIPDPVQDDAGAVLAAAGIDYRTGCCADPARELHGGFLTRVATGRPRLIAKWAATLDGCLATAGGHSQWITAPEALAFSRRHRRYIDAILVGAGTASRDDPALLAAGDGPHPLRVVVDGAARLDPASRLVASIDRAGVLLVHDDRAGSARVAALAERGVETLAVTSTHDLPAVAAALGARGLGDVLVEGGATLHGACLRAGLYDRLECYLAARTLGGGLPIASGHGVERIDAGARWQPLGGPRLLGTTVHLRYRRTIDP